MPVEMSIVSYDLTDGEEAFLSYTWARSHGPPLVRTGIGPPSMRVIDGGPKVATTHPIGLRLGTWLVLEERREAERAEIEKALALVGYHSPEAAVLRKARDELAHLPAHDIVFRELMPDYAIVGMHGCGDLTMNEWKVAFIDGALAEDGKATIVAVSDEPLDLRRYSCLVKWKSRYGGQPRMSIEEIQFKRPEEVDRSTSNLVWLRYKDSWLPRGADMEFAISSPQVIRDGEVISAITSCHQFGDLRHLLQLPNLNPPGELYFNEKNPGRPREYFGKKQTADIWLGEKTLIDGKHNLIRAALKAPITIPTPPNCTEEQLRGALDLARYEMVESPTAPLSRGQWRYTDLVDGEKTDTIEIFFRRNTYSWTMLGLSKDNTRVYCLAATAVVSETGFQLEKAAEQLRDAGAWNALVIDEGFDVFQRILEDDRFVEPVKLKRNRLRAVFVFGRKVLI